MNLLIQFSFGSLWDSVEGFPLFWLVMTGAGLFSIFESVRAFRNKNTDTRRGRILGSGIVALLAGALVFPVGALQAIRVMQIAEEEGGAISIVLGGLYLPFYPFTFGLLWFCVGLGIWKFLGRRAR